MRTREQACVHRQDYAHVESTPETLATQKIEQGFKIINLTSLQALKHKNHENLNYSNILKHITRKETRLKQD